MLWSRNLRMAGRSRCHWRGSRGWRTGHRRSGPTVGSLPVARGSTGRNWMKMSAWRVSWLVADLVRRRSLFVGGFSGGNRPANGAPPELSRKRVQACVMRPSGAGSVPASRRGMSLWRSAAGGRNIATTSIPIAATPFGRIGTAWRASSQIFGLKTGLSRDFRKDGWAKFLGIVKRKRVVRPSVLLHDLVGAYRAVVSPPDPLQCGKYTTRLRRRPGTHAAMSNMAFAESGGNSPWAIRSRTISLAADSAR